MISSVRIYCKPMYFNRRVERHFSSKMTRKSRDFVFRWNSPASLASRLELFLNGIKKIVVRIKIVTTKHIYTRPHTFLALYRHFNKKWRSKQVLLDPSSALSEMMRSWKICPYASKMPTGIVALVVFLVGCLDHRHTDFTCL